MRLRRINELEDSHYKISKYNTFRNIRTDFLVDLEKIDAITEKEKR